MFCSSCGSTANGRFCASCGKWIGDNKTKKNRFWSLLWKTLLLLAILSGAFFYVHYVFQQSLVGTVVDHFDAIRERKITEAYYNFASKELQKVISLDGFKSLVDKTPALSFNEEILIKDSALEYPYGTVEFVLISEEGDETPGRYQLYRDGGKWKIYTIELSLPELGEENSIQEIAQSSTQNPNSQLELDKSKNESVTVSPPAKGTTALMKPVAEQLEALKVGNRDRAYREVFSQDYMKDHTLEDFKKFIDEYPILTKFKTATFENVLDNGTTGSLTVILDPKAGDIPIEYYLVKENDQWKITDLQISLPSQSQQDPKELVPLVEKFVTELKSGNISAAYSEETSKKFKEITPYETFAEFLKRFPIVTGYSKINFNEPKIDKGAGTVIVNFENEQQRLELLFTLGVEETTWKIWGIKILHAGEAKPEVIDEKPASETNLLKDTKSSAPKVQTVKTGHDIGKRPFSSEDLDQVIQQQLSDLKANNVHKAYDAYTSKEFRENTNFEEFADFIKNHPIFQKYRSIHFDNLVFNNNTPTFSGVLIADNGDEYKVEFDFTKEDEAWKVLHIEITPRDANDIRKGGVSEKMSTGQLEFSKAVLGNTIDKAGIVQDAKTLFKSDSGNIFVNLYILNGVKGTRIEMVLKHLDSGSNVPPISTTLQEDGNSVISYDFTNPVRGWPTGRYSLFATSSTGQNKEFTLRIE